MDINTINNLQATDNTSLRELIQIRSNYYILLESLYPEIAHVQLTIMLQTNIWKVPALSLG
jgi:hypothetical protein